MRALSTSEGVNPGRRFWIHVSNCFSNGVRVRGLGLGFWGRGGFWTRVVDRSAVVEIGRRERERSEVLRMEESGIREVSLMVTDASERV